MIRALFALLVCVTAVLSSELRIPLFVQRPGQGEKLPLATLAYDEEAGLLDVSDINSSLEEEPYCVGAQIDSKYYPCFSYVKLRYPLHYDLYLDTKHNANILYKLSLKPNPHAHGIEASLRKPVPGPEAPAVKLRKITKTYEDKKAKLDPSAASFEEDIEIDDRSFLQKNWKFILIGLALYAFSTSGNSSQ